MPEQDTDAQLPELSDSEPLTKTPVGPSRPVDTGRPTSTMGLSTCT